MAEDLGRVTWPPSPKSCPLPPWRPHGAWTTSVPLRARLPQGSRKRPRQRKHVAQLTVLLGVCDGPGDPQQVQPDSHQREDISPWRPASERGGFSTYFEKWFCFTHQWNIEVIELRGPRHGSHFNYLFVFYWERKYGCQVYGGKKADPVLSVLACASE